MLGARIAALRRQAKMSQSELAQRLSVSASAVGMYEQGRREPSSDRLVALAQVFGVTTDYLLTGRTAAACDAEALVQLFAAVERKTGETVLLQRSDGTLSRPTRRELALTMAAVLG